MNKTIIFAAIAAVIVTAATLTLYALQSASSGQDIQNIAGGREKIVEGWKKENAPEPTTPVAPPPADGSPTASGGEGSGSGAGSGTTVAVQQETSPYNIFYLCPFDENPYTQLFETIQKQIIYSWAGNSNCFGQPNPYNVVLQKNETGTEINVRLYGNQLNNTYALSGPTNIFNIYAEDVQDLDFVDSIRLDGSMANYFLVDSYSVDEIWERNEQTEDVELDRKLLRMTLVVDSEIPQFGWSKIKFYIVGLDTEYYIGSMQFFSQ